MILKHVDNARRHVMIALAISVATAAVSCSSRPDVLASAHATSRPAASAPASEPIGSHWFQDQHLRQLMAELTKQKPNWPAGLPQEPEDPAAATQPDQFDEIAVLANALGKAADRLPAVTSHIPMSQADRVGFLAQARTLHEQAAQLQAAANRRSIEQMQRQIESINTTCISCHSRYRDFSGQLDPTQASVDRADILARYSR
jgi:hypothetical protein